MEDAVSASKPHISLDAARAKIAKFFELDNYGGGGYWERQAKFWEGLVEQLEIAERQRDEFNTSNQLNQAQLERTLEQFAAQQARLDSVVELLGKIEREPLTFVGGEYSYRSLARAAVAEIEGQPYADIPGVGQRGCG